MSGPYVLADVNIWLATIVEEHPHHKSAIDWWRNQVLPSQLKVAFCRITQLALLRLLTNVKVMGPQKRAIAQAWVDYENLLSQDPVMYADEPEGLEARLKRYCDVGGSSKNFWTDAYLAAFAQAGDFVFATFDRGFRRFRDLTLALLP